MTYLIMMTLASQREEQIAARVRLPRPDAGAPAEGSRRTGKRDRARGAALVRTRDSRS